MHLGKISGKLIPVTLAAGMVATSFAYSDLDFNSEVQTSITNNRIFEYMNGVKDNDSIRLSQEFRFKMLLNSWSEKTMFLSSPTAIVGDEDFKAIVAMGRAAVPFILNEISVRPSTLVWALNFIFQQKVTDKQGVSIPEACKLWVKKLRG